MLQILQHLLGGLSQETCSVRIGSGARGYFSLSAAISRNMTETAASTRTRPFS